MIKITMISALFLCLYTLKAQNNVVEVRYHSFDIEGGYVSKKGYSIGASYNYALFDHWKIGAGFDYVHQTISVRNIPVTDKLIQINTQYVFKLDRSSDLSFAAVFKGYYGFEIINKDNPDLGDGHLILENTKKNIYGAGTEFEVDYAFGFNRGRNRSYYSVYTRPWVMYLPNSEVGDNLWGIKIGVKYNFMK